jgi:hypothetical protein
MRRPFWNPFRICLVCSGIAAFAAAAFLLLTPQGMDLALHLTIKRLLQPASFSIGRIEGSLARSLVFSEVYLENPRLLPRGTRIAVQELHIETLGRINPRRWRFNIREARLSVPGRLGQASCAFAQGTVDAGFRLAGIAVQDPAGAPAGTRVEALSAEVQAPLFLSPKRWPVRARSLQAQIPRVAESFRGERMQGNWHDGASVYELEATALPWLPEGSALRAQRLELDGGLLRFQPRRVYNGRLLLPEADPVLYSGIVRPAALDLELSAKHVDVQAVAPVFPRWGAIQLVNGTFADVQAKATGRWNEPTFTGHCAVDYLQRKDVRISDGAGTFALSLSRIGRGTQLDGWVDIQRGMLSAKTTTIALQPGRILFSGAPGNPAYDLKGLSVIDGVKMHITLKGTQHLPDLRLSSDPPIQEDWLLLMLATGRRWKGAETSATEGYVSPDLAKDFIDFFILGGLGSRIGQRFGISDISLIFDPQENRVGVATTIADKVEVSYETDQPRPDSTQPAILITEAGATTYRVGAGYKLTEDSSLTIEGERQLSPDAPASAGATTDIPAPLTEESRPKDSILLKFQKKF